MCLHELYDQCAGSRSSQYLALAELITNLRMPYMPACAEHLDPTLDCQPLVALADCLHQGTHQNSIAHRQGVYTGGIGA